MRKSKLILIEGIAGSGKSTVGQKLYRSMSKNNADVTFFHEFDPLNPISELNSENSIELINTSLSHWRSFVDQQRHSNEVTIFDGILSQCLIAELVLMCTDELTIIHHMRELGEILGALGPCVIYLYQKNIQKAITKAYDQRNATWRKKIDTFISNTEFGRKKKLKGLSGYITFNLHYGSVLNRVMSDITIDKISIETSQEEWSTYHAQIAEFLSIPSFENDSIRTLA